MEKRAVIDFLVNTQNALKQIENFKGKINRAADSIKSSLVGKLGAVGTAFLGLSSIKNVYEKTLQLSNLAETFNLPIEKVSLFANQLSVFGGSSEDAAEAIRTLEQSIVDLRTTGGGALRDVAGQVGISLYNANGEIMSSLEIIDQLRDRFKGLNKDAQVKVAQQLGLGSPAALRLLRATDEEYKELTKEAQKFGVINKETQQRVIKMQRSFAKLSQSFLAFGASLIDTFSPAIDALVNGMNWLANQSGLVKGIVVGLVATLGLISPIVGVVGSLAKAFVMVKGAIAGVTTLLAANPIGAALAAVGLTAALVISNWDTVKSWFDGFFGWIDNVVADCINGLKSLFSTLADIFLFPFKAIQNVIGGILDKITSGVMKPINAIKDLISSIPFIGDIFGNKESGGDFGLTSQQQIKTSEGAPSRPNIDNSRAQSTVYNITFSGSYNGAEVERAMQNVIRQNSGGLRC